MSCRVTVLDHLGGGTRAMARAHPAHLPHVLLLPMLPARHREEAESAVSAMDNDHPRASYMVSNRNLLHQGLGVELLKGVVK